MCVSLVRVSFRRVLRAVFASAVMASSLQVKEEVEDGQRSSSPVCAMQLGRVLEVDAYTVQGRLDTFLAPEAAELRCDRDPPRNGCGAEMQMRTREWRGTPPVLILQATRFQCVNRGNSAPRAPLARRKVEVRLTDVDPSGLSRSMEPAGEPASSRRHQYASALERKPHDSSAFRMADRIIC